jgi:Flp pilus assembly protein TadG/uncharacterized protein (UPF0297 family)
MTLRRLRCDRGQAAVLTVAFLTVLLGMTGLAVDVGSWFHSKRDLQAVADAAALAGAQALPDNPTQARVLAIDYGSRNGVTIPAAAISFSSQITTNDTINVHLDRAAPGFFSKVFGIGSVDVGARASARSDNVNSAKYVAPIVVNYKHPMLQCTPPPCNGATSISLADLHKPGSGNASGSFGLIDLGGGNGSVGSGTLADWITNGFNGYLPIGNYNTVTSAKFNSSQIKGALDARMNQELLFPVYKTITGPGNNAVYQIIGFVGFHLTGYDISGNPATLYGNFTRVIWQGIEVSTAGNPDFGVRAVQLVN